MKRKVFLDVQNTESRPPIYIGIDFVVFDRLLGLPFWFRTRGTGSSRDWTAAADSRHLGHDHIAEGKSQVAACRRAAY